MAITDSGQIKFSDIANEYGVSLANVSLSTLSTDIGLTPQHAITEFYGKSSEITIDDLTDTVTTDDGGVTLDIYPQDAIYFGDYHFVTDRYTDGKSLFSDDDGVTWSTDYGSLFDKGARLTKAGDYLVSVGTDEIAYYRFGSEPNSTSDTTYFSNIDMYRTRISTFSTTKRSNAIYYNGYVYYRQGSSVYKWDVSDWTGANIASISESAHTKMPLAVGNDGRMISIGYYGTQTSFLVSDDEFDNYDTIPIPAVDDYLYYQPNRFNQSQLLTNGSGTWIFAPFGLVNGYTYFAYSTDNGESWTGSQDHYYYQDVMDYTPGTSSSTYLGNAGDITSGYYANNKFYLGFSDRLADLTKGGIITSTNGTTMSGIKNIGTGAAAMSFNGSTLIVAGEDKILRFA